MESTITKLMTLEEFEALPSSVTEYMEVVNGVMVPKNSVNEKGELMSPGAKHSGIQLRFGALLLAWATKGDQGYVGTEAGYVIRWDPLMVRFPDVSFLKNDDRPEGDEPDGNWLVPPTFAVEIVSPNDNAYEVRAKVADYLQAGVSLVWTVWPKQREIVAYLSDEAPRTFRPGEILEFPDVLPGFACRVDDLF
jgi:Uma2 family endonuclease